MNALVLLRHGLTRANEERLYGGSTDIPLSDDGRAMAEALRGERPLPACARYVTSGMRRADETLLLLTGRRADFTLDELREMDFGRFEMHSYEQLMGDADYQTWISDETGLVPCPGGESRVSFRARVLSGGEQLLALGDESALVVCHGGTIVNLMQAWFPEAGRNFYEWQPAACRGYRIAVEGGKPIGFEPV